MSYNWQQKVWPDFNYKILKEVDEAMHSFMEETGLVTGMLRGIPEQIKMDSIVNLMITEAIKTSEIEGEHLDHAEVASSIMNNLGLAERKSIKDRKAEGIGKLMVAARNSFKDPLTQAMLFEWHKMLFMGSKTINAGAWRKSKIPMQITSGAIGKEKIHFEAPPSSRVAKEMELFIQWFNATAPEGNNSIKKAPLRAAIAHIYFESIHPFEDGNGRIGRAIAEKALSQTVGRPVLLSLSRVIEADKKSYYAALENAQRSIDITEWIKYFVTAILNAQIQSRSLIDYTLEKTKFFNRYQNELNERQLKVVKRMFEGGIEGFKGGMTSKKYMSITGTSKATATRDLVDLFDKKAFLKIGDTRSSAYVLNLENSLNDLDMFEKTGTKIKKIKTVRQKLIFAITALSQIKFHYESTSKKEEWRIAQPYILGVKANGNIFLAALEEDELDKPKDDRIIRHFTLSKIDLDKLEIGKKTYVAPEVPETWIKNTPTIRVMSRFIYDDEPFKKFRGRIKTSNDALELMNRFGSPALPIIWEDIIEYENELSGITGYKPLTDGIILEFKSKDLYLYNHDSPGKEHVDQMKKLAKKGSGLTTYVNQSVRKYREKFTTF
jgi:Fic family protein